MQGFLFGRAAPAVGLRERDLAAFEILYRRVRLVRESVAEDGWLSFRVHAAVAELPERERVPLELAYWGRRSQREIAELLGLPLGTVETRTRSVLTRLAVRLDGSE